MIINVGVLRGGFGKEYDISLKSGGVVLSNLPRDKYQPIDLLVSKDGQWHMDGMPIDVKDLKSTVDIILNNLHGVYGEDGLVQELLNNHDIPHTGSSPLASRLSFNKNLSKEKFRKLGYKTPLSEIISLPEKMEAPYQEKFTQIVNEGVAKVFTKISPPWVVKPLSGSHSIDIFFAKDMETLSAALTNVLLHHDHALVEQHIKGREMVLGIVEGFRDKEQYSLLPLEVIKQKEILDFDDRLNKNYSLISPKDLNMDEKIKLAEISSAIHENFELEGCSVVDLILSKNGIYILEVDNMPGFSEHSMFPEMLQNVGADIPSILDCMIRKALAKNNSNADM